MAIPDYETLMRPVLGLVLYEPKHYRDCAAELVITFNLTQDEVEELLPRARRTVFVDRVYWATAYLKAAGAIERPKRGFVLATDRGRYLHRDNPERIDTQALMQFPEFAEFRQRSSSARGRGLPRRNTGTYGEDINEMASQTQESIPSGRMPTPRIPIPRDEIAAFCRKWRIIELALFGSVLRDDFTPESDVDALARFSPDAEHTLYDLYDMEQELAAALGRKTHIGSWEAVERSKNPYRRKDVLGSAQVIYDAA